MSTRPRKTNRTLSHSEQKALDVIFVLQRLGALPSDPWTAIGLDRVSLLREREIRNGDGSQKMSLYERKVRVEWGSRHTLECTLQSERETFVSSRSDQMPHPKPNKPKGSNEDLLFLWKVVSLKITRSSSVWEGTKDVRRTFFSEDPESIEFLLRLGEPPPYAFPLYPYGHMV